MQIYIMYIPDSYETVTSSLISKKKTTVITHDLHSPLSHIIKVNTRKKVSSVSRWPYYANSAVIKQ